MLMFHHNDKKRIISGSFFYRKEVSTRIVGLVQSCMYCLGSKFVSIVQVTALAFLRR